MVIANADTFACWEEGCKLKYTHYRSMPFELVRFHWQFKATSLGDKNFVTVIWGVIFV